MRIGRNTSISSSTLCKTRRSSCLQHSRRHFVQCTGLGLIGSEMQVFARNLIVQSVVLRARVSQVLFLCDHFRFRRLSLLERVTENCHETRCCARTQDKRTDVLETVYTLTLLTGFGNVTRTRYAKRKVFSHGCWEIIKASAVLESF